MDKVIGKDIEEKFAFGKPFEWKGETYRIRNMCKYYKVFRDGKVIQYDIALYLTKEDDRSYLRIAAFNLD